MSLYFMQDQSTPLHLLMIEDSPSDAGLLLRELRRGGFDVYYTRVEAASELIEALGRQDWDVVISDYHLPQFDAGAALPIVKQHDVNLPFIVVSGTVGEDTAVRMMKSGAHDYLLKDKLARLVPAVQRELAEARIRRERHTALAALEASEERYRRLVDYATDAIFLHDLDGRIIDANEHACSSLGYTRIDLLQKNMDDLVPRVLDAPSKHVWHDLTPGVPVNVSAVHRRRDGSTLYVETRLMSFLSKGQPMVLAVARDISERKRAEEQLRLSAEVFERSREAILITDRAGRIVSINRAFIEMTGYTEKDILGQTMRYLSTSRQDADFFAAIGEGIRQDGHWQGEFWGRKKGGGHFPVWLSIVLVKDEHQQTRHYICVANDISEFKYAEERIYYLAHYDVLTDLPNRAMLRERMPVLLSEAQFNQEQVAVLFIDVDRFKSVNDTLGHHAGDNVLATVARRLKSCISSADIVARMGGDEFVLVLPKTGAERAVDVAQCIVTALNEPLIVEHHRVNATSSIGISIYPHDGQTMETLIKNADAALYHAKTLGRNNYQFFTTQMNIAAAERRLLEHGLLHAIERNELELYYQPQVEVHSGHVVGVEALLRWHHPELGTIMPNRLIPVAENTGLIVPIGEWVLREACLQNARWQAQGLHPIVVSVNLSALQIRQDSFERMVQDALTCSNLAPQYLELELTESLLMESANSTMSNVKELTQIGVRLSVDDFGTGYSNLSYLRRFPLAKLKIDRSFVREAPHNGGDVAIVRAVIGLAHNLNLKVIAEGVETREQLDFLRAEGCDQIQGYFFARPCPASDLQDVLLNGYQIELAGCPSPFI